MDIEKSHFSIINNGMKEDKKFIETLDVNDWEVLTDDGWQDIIKIHKTIPYTIWKIQTESFELECADKHLVFDKNFIPTFIDELSIGDEIWTENGLEKITSIIETNDEENMYDLELPNDSNHRYYTNGILSHNTITSAIYLLWFATVNNNKEILICAQSKDAAMENLAKIRLTYEYCPDFLKKGLVSDNKSTLIFDNGSRIIVRPSTIKAPRGLSPAIVYVDEFAFIGSQDSADKALEKQEEFFGALSPTLSASKGKLFITSTPISETDLFYRLWNGGIKKTNDKGLLLPKDYILSVDGELYKDFHLFKTWKEADSYMKSIRTREKDHKFKVVEKEPCGNNSFQTQLVKWDACPLKDKDWAEKELKKVGPEKFAKEYNCIGGDTIVQIMDEQGFIREVPVKNLYDFY